MKFFNATYLCKTLAENINTNYSPLHLIMSSKFFDIKVLESDYKKNSGS